MHSQTADASGSALMPGDDVVHRARPKLGQPIERSFDVNRTATNQASELELDRFGTRRNSPKIFRCRGELCDVVFGEPVDKVRRELGGCATLPHHGEGVWVELLEIDGPEPGQIGDDRPPQSGEGIVSRSTVDVIMRESHSASHEACRIPVQVVEPHQLDVGRQCIGVWRARQAGRCRRSRRRASSK